MARNSAELARRIRLSRAGAGLFLGLDALGRVWGIGGDRAGWVAMLSDHRTSDRSKYAFSTKVEAMEFVAGQGAA